MRATHKTPESHIDELITFKYDDQGGLREVGYFFDKKVASDALWTYTFTVEF